MRLVSLLAVLLPIASACPTCIPEEAGGPRWRLHGSEEAGGPRWRLHGSVEVGGPRWRLHGSEEAGGPR